MSHHSPVSGLDTVHHTDHGVVRVEGHMAHIIGTVTDTTRWALSGGHTGSLLAGTAGWMTVDLRDGTVVDVSDTWMHVDAVDLTMYQLETLHEAGERTLVVSA